MSTSLYQKYRPDTFERLIGQDHIVSSLTRALDSKRLTHAYLFSGPRGCGKTTTARIMARCLNCEKGPTSKPCGKCKSCVELSDNGTGSVDVTEIDAASHNTVDDARDLREKAIFNPTRDRYKIFILDEAHMITQQGFNAMLKLVEEPPEHVKFIFATTEPEKVISTIRSRTYHYPFTLVSNNELSKFVDTICKKEKMKLESGVNQLVVKAGNGSVRDTLSILDQLFAAANPENIVEYDMAEKLLGVIPNAYICNLTSSICDGNFSEAIKITEDVINSGYKVDVFADSLLNYFRDLIFISAAGSDIDENNLLEIDKGNMGRAVEQINKLGRNTIIRFADLCARSLSVRNTRINLEILISDLMLLSEKSSEAKGTSVSAKSGEIEKLRVPAKSSEPERTSVPEKSNKVASLSEPEKSNETKKSDATNKTSTPAKSNDTKKSSEPAKENTAIKKETTKKETTKESENEPAKEQKASKTMNWNEVVDILKENHKVLYSLIESYLHKPVLKEKNLILEFADKKLGEVFSARDGETVISEIIKSNTGKSFTVTVEAESKDDKSKDDNNKSAESKHIGNKKVAGNKEADDANKSAEADKASKVNKSNDSDMAGRPNKSAEAGKASESSVLKGEKTADKPNGDENKKASDKNEPEKANPVNSAKKVDLNEIKNSLPKIDELIKKGQEAATKNKAEKTFDKTTEATGTNGVKNTSETKSEIPEAKNNTRKPEKGNGESQRLSEKQSPAGMQELQDNSPKTMQESIENIKAVFGDINIVED